MFKDYTDKILLANILREAEEADGKWVTINGVHILIKDGETAIDAFKRVTGKDLDVDNSDYREGKVSPDVFQREDKTKTLIKKYMSELPEEHTANVNVNASDDLGSVKIEGFSGAKVLADYNPGENSDQSPTIRGHTSLGDDDKSRTAIYHEVGHNVYRKVLSQSDRDEWTDFFDKNKVVFSDYGASKPTEGFASAYSLWQQNPFALGPDVNKWFSKKVKLKK